MAETGVGKVAQQNIKKKNEIIINKNVETTTKKSSDWGTDNLNNTRKVKKAMTFLLQLNWKRIFLEKMSLVNKILGYFQGISNIWKGMEAVDMFIFDLLFIKKNVQNSNWHRMLSD